MNTAAPHRPFDSNLAWQQAAALMKGNRDVLIALAGAFVVLPAFAMAVLLPQPSPAEGVEPAAYLATLGQYYQDNAPALIASALVHLAGTLAMLALFTDAARPTVGEAIRTAFVRMPAVIFAQIILGAAVGAMLLVPVVLAETLKAPALAALGVVAALGLGGWAMVRLSLIPPVVMIERLGNPVQALRRTWQITEGHALRLLVFYALVFIAFFVSSAVLEGLVQAVVALLAGKDAGVLVGTLIATCVQAAMTVCFTAIFAAAYHQLAAPPAQDAAATFR